MECPLADENENVNNNASVPGKGKIMKGSDAQTESKGESEKDVELASEQADHDLEAMESNDESVPKETGIEEASTVPLDHAQQPVSSEKSDNQHDLKTITPELMTKTEESASACPDCKETETNKEDAGAVSIEEKENASCHPVSKQKEDKLPEQCNESKDVKSEQTPSSDGGKGDSIQIEQENEADKEESERKGDGDNQTSLEELAARQKDCILQPLTFPNSSEAIRESQPSEEAVSSEDQKMPDDSFEQKFAPSETPCMLCDNMYEDVETKEQHDEYLCHLVVEHKMVIADVKLIANLRSYAIYWKKRFLEKPIEEFCTSIKTNMSPTDVEQSELYFLLCDALPEDRRIREKLQLERLKELIDQQTEERNNEDFERMCLFCTKFFIGNRMDLFNHMNEDHNFNVGHPHNLIHIEEFLNEIEKKLNNLECLYCERVFKDRASLREHMRKKSHRRLNPKNKTYDKYYIINYLELGKNWEVLQGEPDQLEPTEDWSGWDEDCQTAVCFFCSASFSTRDPVYGHMKEAHGFDFPEMRKEMNLSFYQQVKMINYIRREVHQSRDADDKVKGDEKVKDEVTRANELANRIKESILTTTKWNQPQYYFPTYENDTLLCQLEDKEGLFEPEDTFIIGEDGIDCKAIINESVLTDLVVRGYFD